MPYEDINELNVVMSCLGDVSQQHAELHWSYNPWS